MKYTTLETSIQASPYKGPETYKLTRAMWFALYAPDSGRHDALLADGIPAVYRRLFDAILEGSDGIARVMRERGEELALLDTVARLPKPSLIPTRRLELPEGSDLAAELFGGLIDDPDTLNLGEGEWPKRPSHTCGATTASGTVITIRANRTQAARMVTPKWRTCPGCMFNRALRIARQTLLTIKAVGPMTWTYLNGEKEPGEKNSEFGRWREKIRKHVSRTGVKVHYRAMPLEDGRIFIMATAGLAGQPVRTDRAELHKLIQDHADTPDLKRISSNDGYGGDWQGIRGDGRAKAKRKQEKGEKRGKERMAQLWTTSALEKVAESLGHAQKGQDRITIEREAVEVYEALVNAGIPLQSRKKHESALEALLGTIAADSENVPHKGQKEEYKFSVPYAGHLPPSPPESKGVEPRLFNHSAEPAPIYLGVEDERCASNWR